MINHTHLLMFVKYRDTSEQRKAFHFFLPISYSNSVHAEPVEAWTEYSRKTGPFTLRPRSGRTDSLMLVFLSLYYTILDNLSGATLRGLGVDDIDRVTVEVAQNVINGAGKRPFVVLHADKAKMGRKDNVVEL